MRILIAEDDVTSRRVLEVLLSKRAYDVVAACDGDEAWALFQAEDAPQLGILDWMMPGKDGPEVCRLVRERRGAAPVYLILLTTKGRTEDIVTGLNAGADDYVTKPFEKEELFARVKAGERILGLQTALADRIEELQAALTEIRTLQGLLPICGYCKKIRNDNNYWQQFESYIAAHSQARFSHGICPDCYEKIVKPELDALAPREEDGSNTTNE